MEYPLISIVVPNYNLGDYLEQTLLSIIHQKYPKLELILIDGGSTDNSLSIINRYKDHFSYWISEKDDGLYDAIQKGFNKSSGDIMTWINSDDLIFPNSLFQVANIFQINTDIEWILGQPTFINKSGGIEKILTIRKWTKNHFYAGDYKWIQQESVFWTRSLWEKAGNKLNTTYKYAGDFELWLRFFNSSKLYSLNFPIGGFRQRPFQLSKIKETEYLKEVQQAINHQWNSFSFKEKTSLTIKRYIFKFLSLLSKTKIFNPKIFDKLINKLFNAPSLIKLQKENE